MQQTYVGELSMSIGRAYDEDVTNPFSPFLLERGVAILDGGLATELERRGLDLDDPLWSAKVLLDAPEQIESLHYDYYRAGADVGVSASYQATFAGFAARGIDEKESERLLKFSVELARRARDRFWSESSEPTGRLRPLVAASVGCYGASLHDGSEYRGDYGLSLEELTEFHRKRLEVLAAAGPDLLAFETIPSRLEAEAVVQLLDELGAGAPPAWISFSCRSGNEVSHGESLSECFEIASRSDAVVAVGINCTPPRLISDLLTSARDATEKLLVVYPNSGESWDGVRHRWVGGESSIPIESLAPEWYRLGARLIGGCCRTTPENIRALATGNWQLRTRRRYNE